MNQMLQDPQVQTSKAETSEVTQPPVPHDPVPEHPRFMALYAEMSRAAVATLGPQLDLRYGPGAKETLDLFVPATRPRGTFVFIHGGCCTSRDWQPQFEALAGSGTVLTLDLRCHGRSSGAVGDCTVERWAQAYPRRCAATPARS